jgi:hypothetical protein
MAWTHGQVQATWTAGQGHKAVMLSVEETAQLCAWHICRNLENAGGLPGMAFEVCALCWGCGTGRGTGLEPELSGLTVAGSVSHTWGRH